MGWRTGGMFVYMLFPHSTTTKHYLNHNKMIIVLLYLKCSDWHLVLINLSHQLVFKWHVQVVTDFTILNPRHTVTLGGKKILIFLQFLVNASGLTENQTSRLGFKTWQI